MARTRKKTIYNTRHDALRTRKKGPTIQAHGRPAKQNQQSARNKLNGRNKIKGAANLLDVDTTGQQVRGDKYAGRARAELSHDNVTLPLAHVPVHARDGEVSLLIHATSGGNCGGRKRGG